MEPTQNGAYIEIRVIRKTWKEAVDKVNEWTEEINNTFSQMKKDVDPITQWKHENDRWVRITAEKEKLNAR